MVLIFDLDDTLYDEITFVYSGFNAVSDYLSSAYGLDNKSVFKACCSELDNNGRGQVFNTVLKKYNLYSKSSVKKCLSVYRSHFPKISLNKDAIDYLNYFKGPKYVVTDGNRIVQGNKAKALQLSDYVKKVFVTHAYGLKNSKPSPYCFEKIAAIEKVSYDQCVYIGDNPKKDFVTIKKLGFKTIRIKQGMFKDVKMDEEHDAHESIHSLLDLKVSKLLAR
jgi:putative hydrolase of the HAD superfamily